MTQIQCPNCYRFIDILDGVGYCILCEEVVIEIEDEKTNNLIDIKNLFKERGDSLWKITYNE